MAWLPGPLGLMMFRRKGTVHCFVRPPEVWLCLGLHTVSCVPWEDKDEKGDMELKAWRNGKACAAGIQVWYLHRCVGSS